MSLTVNLTPKIIWINKYIGGFSFFGLGSEETSRISHSIMYSLHSLVLHTLLTDMMSSAKEMKKTKQKGVDMNWK